MSEVSLRRLMDSTSRIPSLPSGSVSPEKSKKKRYNGYYKRRAEAIYELQTREHIVRRKNEGASFEEIAKELGQSRVTVWRYYRKTMDRVVDMVPYDPKSERFDEDLPWNRPGSRWPHPDDVLDPPDEVLLKKEALALAKAAKPIDVIANQLGISEKKAREYITGELSSLEKSELNEASLQRRLMIEQINEMIEGVYAPATGNHPTKGKVAPVLEAVDRLMKLLKQKAELMGLDRPQYTDIDMKLMALAEEAGYDIEELHEVARDVLLKHRIKIPGLRSVSR